MSSETQTPAAEPPPPEPAGLPAALHAIQDVHDAVVAATGRVKLAYPDDDKLLKTLSFIHDAVAAAGDHVSYHMDLAKSSKEWGQIVLGQATVATIGIALGHFLTLPKESGRPVASRAASFVASLKPETREQMVKMLQQGMALAAAWLQAQEAQSGPVGQGKPAESSPADEPAPEPS